MGITRENDHNNYDIRMWVCDGMRNDFLTICYDSWILAILKVAISDADGQCYLLTDSIDFIKCYLIF